MDHNTLLEWLHYDPDTGVLTWLRGPKKGMSVTSTNGRPMAVFLLGKGHVAARLIWFWMTKEHPKGVIDHINGDPTDNRWVNIRDVCLTANNRNRATSKPLKGAFLRTGSWWGHISGRVVSLGYFDTREEAQAMWLKLRKDLGYVDRDAPPEGGVRLKKMKPILPYSHLYATAVVTKEQAKTALKNAERKKEKEKMRKTTSITVSLPDEVLEALDAHCVKFGAKRSSVVKVAVKRFLSYRNGERE